MNDSSSMNCGASQLDRRRFGAAIAGCVVAGGLVSSARGASAAPVASAGEKPTFRKAVKWGMILEGTTALDKFRLCKELGYDGMELVSPLDTPLEELLAASAATGMPIHGLVDMKHWDIRLSAPDQATRDQGRGILEQAIRDAHAMGGHAVLLVPGKVGDDATHDEVWSRSIPEVRRVLPLAATLGVRVLIENVWNGFCETPELYRDYIDAIGNPWVGAYFDIGNCRKFGASEDWARTLGNRIVKLDVKDWGDTEGFCKIGDGDVNWPAVRAALSEIGYHGWCTAEVEGGGRAELADIAARMDRVLVG
ncbi:MAG: sugar phosphate isomerase/epimerase family protein [Lacipirellulaceae bacterium]